MRAPSLALALGALLSGCAAAPPPPPLSLVDVQPADGAALAGIIVDQVGHRIRPSEGPLVVLAPRRDTVLTPAVVAGLQKAGYTVVSDGKAPHRVTYQAGPVGDGMLLRITVDDDGSAEILGRDGAAALTRKGPVTAWSFAR